MARRRRPSKPKPEEAAVSPAPRFLRERFGWALGVICLLGLIQRTAILIDYVRHNPFAKAPVIDGAMYWEWAGRIAAGEWIGPTPFVSAPLYPYLLAVIRATGGGLVGVYVLQLLLDIGTAAILGWIARRRFGEAVGLVAAVVWLLLDEPAFYLTRVLNSTTQVFLVLVLWALWSCWRDGRRWATAVALGLVLGLNCLGNPPMLALLVVLPLVAWFDRRFGGDAPRSPSRPAKRKTKGRPDAAGDPAGSGTVAQVLVCGVLAIATIAPATLHNWWACEEFIPIMACPGITLRQGNAPGAVGTYVPIPGVSRGREHLFTDAARVYQRATGKPVRWRKVDAFFRDRALTYWREDPARAARLFVRRAYWFVSGRYYCDVHQPTWERDQGLTRLFWLAPIPTAWLMGPALVGLVWAWRRPLRYAPAILLFAVPFLIVVIVQYSPRYRFPAMPVVTVLSTWALVRAARPREGWLRSAVVWAMLVLSIALGPINKLTGFEDPDRLAYNNEYNLSVALRKLDRTDEAVRRLRRALEILPTSPDAHNDLGTILADRGRHEEAIKHYRHAVRSRPGWAMAESNLGLSYAALGEMDRAIEHHRRAFALRPNWPQVAMNLANVLFQAGEFRQAVEGYNHVLSLRPNHPDAHDNLGLALSRLGRHAEAVTHWRSALQSDPHRFATRLRLASGLAALGDYGEAIGILEQAVKEQPENLVAVNQLAWLLATCPEPGLRDGTRAVALAERLYLPGDEAPAAWLDTLAAAYAELGAFAKATKAAELALRRARRLGDSEAEEAIAERLDLFRERRPFRLKR